MVQGAENRIVTYKNNVWKIFARTPLWPVVGTFQDSFRKSPIGIGNWNITSENFASDAMQLKLSMVRLDTYAFTLQL